MLLLKKDKKNIKVYYSSIVLIISWPMKPWLDHLLIHGLLISPVLLITKCSLFCSITFTGDVFILMIIILKYLNVICNV